MQVQSALPEVRYSLLRPVNKKPRSDFIHIIKYVTDINELSIWLDKLDKLVALDIETKGADPAEGGSVIIGIGLASSNICLYIDITSISAECKAYLYKRLKSFNLIGHNVMFDGTYLYRDMGEWLNWVGCTYAMYKHLASEGYPQQRWGLKQAQIDMLGWPATNEEKLDSWLRDHGYVKGPWSTPANESREDKEIRLAKIKQTANPPPADKSQMYRAPAHILGHYCALDADATWQLYKYVLEPVVSKFDAYIAYHKEFLNLVKLLAESQLDGIQIDKESLITYQGKLQEKIQIKHNEFFTHQDVAPYIQEYNQQVISEFKKTEPVKFKVKKKVGKEPVKLTKSGDISKSWIKWNIRRTEIEAANPDTSKNWLNWKDKLDLIESQFHFNLNSKDQLIWLFYEKLGYKPELFTETGKPVISKKILHKLGETGELLKTYNDMNKEMGYINACLEHLKGDILHPRYKAPGTLTGRLAGDAGLNVQQLPKSRGYLECWKPREGHVWVNIDHSSLEQVVLAELSRDPTLLKLYGPTAKPNDVYLFNGAYLPIIGPKIHAAGYDPDNPTQEGINAAKKVAKKERDISKIVTLASSYGAGAFKIQESLSLKGVQLSVEECKKIHSSYWELYSGVKVYERFLKTEWERNDGWVFNGIGRPTPICEMLLKDLVNRVVQSTGHDIHIKYVNILDALRKETQIPFWGIIWDFHDQSIVETPKEYAEDVKYLLGVEAYARLNMWLGVGDGALIPLKGDASIVRSLAEAKFED